MQPVVVDPEMVGQLVDDGDEHLLLELVEIDDHLAQLQPVEGDPIRELEAAVVVAFGAGHALVETEESLRMAVVDQDHDVVEQGRQLVGEGVERIADELLEAVDIDRIHRRTLRRRARLSPTRHGLYRPTMDQGAEPAPTVYDLVVIGGTAGGLSVAIDGQRAGLTLVRLLAEDAEVAFPELVSERQLDVGYGEHVSSIDSDGDQLLVTSTKQTYRTRACVVANRSSDPDAEANVPVAMATPEGSARVHLNEPPDGVTDADVLVVGYTDHAVELTSLLVHAGNRVVLAAGGMEPERLSPAGDTMLRRMEKDRLATILYRALPDQIGEIEGYPMAFFDDRRTPDLQFDHVVFSAGRVTATPESVGLTDAARDFGTTWFFGQASEREAATVPIAPGWALWRSLAETVFPDLPTEEPKTPAQRRRGHAAAIEELRTEHYNATITTFEPSHSDLWVLRVKPDSGTVSHRPGQYASLGLGYWEDRIDDAVDPDLEGRWEKLVRRSYSISSRMLDDHGYLVDDTQADDLEFYIVLVPPTPDNVPGLTPRLALKRPGDRIYLGPKVAGRYTTTAVTDPADTLLFFSTGTGEAPHNAMVVEMLSKGHHGPIVSAISVRQWADLGYREKHDALAERFPNYHYLPLPTREPDVPKRYIQDILRDGTLTGELGLDLDPEHSHVFLCGNPAMIGLPENGEGEPTWPEPTGVVELLVERGFTIDRRTQRGNIHFEEYW